jgi:hypothetical protein
MQQAPGPFPLLAGSNSRPSNRPHSIHATRKKEVERCTKLFNHSKLKVFKAANLEKGNLLSFPSDFYTCDIVAGFQYLAELQGKNAVQKQVFSRIFDGAKLVKSTLSKYRKFLRTALPDLLEEFVEYGHTSDGLFPCFVEAVKPNQGKKKACLPESEDEYEEDESTEEEDVLGGKDPDDSQSDDDSDDINKEKARRYKLCPFCNAQMPPQSSNILIKMLIELHSKTKKDPLSINRKGQVATSFVVYAEFCERHQYEAVEFPKAKAAGWTDKIDFSKLESHIEALKDDLDLIVEDVNGSSFFERACQGSNDKLRAPKGYSTFTEQGAGWYVSFFTHSGVYF